MTFETLNDNVMLVELSGDEMEKLHITYESLNDSSEDTQIALKSLLCRIDLEKRFSKGQRVVVEAMPTENGGCFFIFTITNKKRRYKVKRNDISLIFGADSLDDFLDFITVAKKNINMQQICEAYKLKNNYFLFIPKENEEINRLVSEYGERLKNISYEWLNEHCNSLGKVYLQ